MITFYYEYKGNKYKFLHRAKMKIGQTWIDCVVYRSEENSIVYVREFIDFIEKFIPV